MIKRHQIWHYSDDHKTHQQFTNINHINNIYLFLFYCIILLPYIYNIAYKKYIFYNL